jgi:hypothetical protein
MEKSTLRIKHLSTLFVQVLPLPELLQFLKQFSHESNPLSLTAGSNTKPRPRGSVRNFSSAVQKTGCPFGRAGRSESSLQCPSW